MIGESVGNYRVLELLGEGGMGAVYLAEHPGIGRRAAVKVLHPSYARNPEVMSRFFNEARVATAARHPGIVEIFDFGTLPSGATYIIMELLEGESLGTRLRREGRLEIGTATHVACQTADALAAAHRVDVVHRDLKPDNLFLARDVRANGRDVVKVLDFGVAKLSAEVADAGARSVKTRTGTLLGTPVYMSPEQCRGTQEVDRRSDIYALGVVLYEMVCGQPPFSSEGYGELIHMHIAVPPPPLLVHNPAVPPELEAVVAKALEKNPVDRYQTMEELAGALSRLPAWTVGDTIIYPRDPSARDLARAPVQTRLLTPAAGPSTTTFSSAASVIERTSGGRARSKVALPAMLAGTGTLAAVAWLLFSGKNAAPERERPPEETRRAAVTTPGPGPTPAPNLPVATPPPKAVPEALARIAIALTTQPPGARVVRERDGADLGVTPWKASWAPATGGEPLRLELEGFAAERFVLPLDRSVELAFALKKKRAAAHPRLQAPKPPPQPTPREPVPL